MVCKAPGDRDGRAGGDETAVCYAARQFVAGIGARRHGKNLGHADVALKYGQALFLAAASGAIYIPFEVRHIYPGHIAIPLAALALNLATVAFMLRSLWANRGRGRRGARPAK